MRENSWEKGAHADSGLHLRGESGGERGLQEAWRIRFGTGGRERSQSAVFHTGDRSSLHMGITNLHGIGQQN